MIFLVVFGAMAIGVGLIALIGASDRKRGAPGGPPRLVPGGEQMPFEEFQALIIDLLDALHLSVVHMVASSTEIDIIVRSSEPLTGGRFLVHAVWNVPGDVVDQPLIMRLVETVRADSASK